MIEFLVFFLGTVHVGTLREHSLWYPILRRRDIYLAGGSLDQSASS